MRREISCDIPINNGSRELNIDFVKLVAAFFVLNLHAIGIGNGLREYIYLVGSYGIPLFFLVNGYLRSKKLITINLIRKCLFRYLVFDAMWSIIIAIPLWIRTKKIMVFDLLYGAIIGKGLLSHFWFLMALIVIYTCVYLLSKLIGHEKLDSIVSNRYFLLVNAVVLMISFVANIILSREMKVEIRDVIPAPLRIITNGSYFLIGMHVGRTNTLVRIKRISSIYTTVFFFLLTLIIYFIASNIKMVWASSYYSSVFVLAGTLLIFYAIHKKGIGTNKSIIIDIINTSTGIWILHPFVLLGLRKFLYAFSLNETLLISIILLVISFAICIFGSIIIQKTKILRMLVKP